MQQPITKAFPSSLQNCVQNNEIDFYQEFRIIHQRSTAQVTAAIQLNQGNATAMLNLFQQVENVVIITIQKKSH